MSDLQPTAPPVTGTGCLVRAAWTMGGPILMLACAIAMSKQEPLGFSWPDAVFAALFALMLAARHIDVSRFHGTDGDGAPVTRQGLTRWYVMAVVLSLVGWVAGHGLAYVMA